MSTPSRRDFIKVVSSGSLAFPLAALGVSCGNADTGVAHNATAPFTLGMASYTFRAFGVDETIAMTKRLGLTAISYKSFHLPLETPVDEIKKVAAKTRDAGLDLYGCGVVYMKNEEEVNRAFTYAHAAGMRVMIGVPNHELLEMVNEKVQEYDIKLAIHNHGPGDELYPSPESAYEKVKNLDPRMGLCLDIGHTRRYGLDPIADAKRFADRLYDIHIKDVSKAAAEGGTIEMGRGVIDIPEFLRAIIALNYRGVVAFEFEKDEGDPLPGVAESVGYVRGVLDAI